MKILDIKAPLKDATDAIFWAALEASVASDYDCRMAYARCLESDSGPNRERLATLVNEWMTKTLERIHGARKSEPESVVASCDCGGTKAKTLHAQWCATLTGRVTEAPRAEPWKMTSDEVNIALAKGIDRYKRKVERLEADLARSRSDYSQLVAASTAVARERWSGPRISELKARNEQLAALVVKLGGNPQPAQRLAGEYGMSLRDVFG